MPGSNSEPSSNAEASLVNTVTAQIVTGANTVKQTTNATHTAMNNHESDAYSESTIDYDHTEVVPAKSTPNLSTNTPNGSDAAHNSAESDGETDLVVHRKRHRKRTRYIVRLDSDNASDVSSHKHPKRCKLNSNSHPSVACIQAPKRKTKKPFYNVKSSIVTRSSRSKQNESSSSSDEDKRSVENNGNDSGNTPSQNSAASNSGSLSSSNKNPSHDSDSSRKKTKHGEWNTTTHGHRRYKRKKNSLVPTVNTKNTVWLR